MFNGRVDLAVSFRSTTHDPVPMLHLLRDQLAAPDKHLSFLFGAGTSSAVNIAPAPPEGGRRDYLPLIPAIARMTELCAEAVAAVSKEHERAWRTLSKECKALGLEPNIESILSRLRMKIDAAGPSDPVLGLERAAAASLEATIRRTIAALASPDEASIPEVVPHDEFASWIHRAERRHPVEIFTTNYDVLIERSLERRRVPVFDGFVGSYRPFFSPDALDGVGGPQSRWTRLWKLHGSTTWANVGTAPVRLSETGSGDVILPSHRKYDESRKLPYLALMDRLSRALATPGALLVTTGYSWGDEHINEVLLAALDANASTSIVALMFDGLDASPHVVRAAALRDNLIVLGRAEGIIRGERRTWALTAAIASPVSAFVDPYFDSDALVAQGDSAVPGALRLGDFNVLAAFLRSLAEGAES